MHEIADQYQFSDYHNEGVRRIAGPLSLRRPQLESLNILARIADQLPLRKAEAAPDLGALLAEIRAQHPTCTDFEREFPSVCFSLATGVGKTRLMGACVEYLYAEKGVRNFFVLAPNLTIYEKLIADFSQRNSSKYVFAGFRPFAQHPPNIVTGENYEQAGTLFAETEVRINIFNVSKFNSETRAAAKGGEKGKPPRIKRMAEYLGESYWNYLMKLPDLVLLMDEAHRYHADKSKEAINELRPVLGIELTATPIDEKGNMFKNVVYEYSLGRALQEGHYVKAPAIATRRDFVAKGKTAEEIENTKLDDTISLHEDIRTELELYHRQSGERLVKPLALIAARNTDHARALYDRINSAQFCEGAYVGKVLQVDSTNTNDDEVARLLVGLEDTQNPIEIVIHVFKLKEGWDVNNLYTICPLNAANSHVLIEQTIGRGLRLPFGGRRTGIEKLDKLTIVAHDNFDSLLREAQNPDSVLNKIRLAEVYVDDIAEKQVVVQTPSRIEAEIAEEIAKIAASDAPNKENKLRGQEAKQLVIRNLPAQAFTDSVNRIEDLKLPEVKAKVLKKIEKELYEGQQNLFAADILEEAQAHYETFVDSFRAQTIEIPRMVLQTDAVIPVFHDFELDTSAFNYVKLKEEILRVDLTDKTTDIVEVRYTTLRQSPREMLMVVLNNKPEIDYETGALQTKLCDQALAALAASLPDARQLPDVVRQHRQPIADRIYQQMMAHFEVIQPGYQQPNVLPFTRIEAWNNAQLANDGQRHYTDESMPASQVRKYLFTGFKKAGHAAYKFDSHTERLFAWVLESDAAAQKWLRPAPQQFQLYYRHNSRLYEPDFVVETADCIYLVEVKALKDLENPDILEKATVARLYCQNATDFTAQHNGKPWRYALIPHDKVLKTNSLMGMLSQAVG